MLKGYCASIPFLNAVEQENKLLAQGAAAARIYRVGRGEESAEALFRALRPGDEVAIAGTLRVFGASRKAMMAAIAEVHAKKAVLVEIPEGLRSDRDGAVMLDRGLSKLHGSLKVKESKRFARAIGAKGGKGKGQGEAQRRDAVAEDRVIRAIVNAPELTWARKVEILGIKEATLRRHYYKQ